MGLGKSANISIELNGKQLAHPREWFDVSILATFEQQSQANITTEKFSFVLDAYTELRNHIDNSSVGIFEGIPFTLRAINSTNEYIAFNGFVDLADKAIINDTTGEIQASVKKLTGLNSFSDNLEAIDFGFLKDKGLITSTDYVTVKYVVIKIDASFESLVSAIMLFLLIKQLEESIRIAVKSVLEVVAIATGSAIGSIAAAVYALAVAIVNIAYAAAILAAVIDLGRDLITTFVHPIREHKAMLLKTMLTKVCSYLGYSFESDIAELDYLHYLPSNTVYDEFDDRGFLKSVGTISEGIPHITDYGYSASELFSLVKNMFNARFDIVESTNTVHLHTASSDYWIKQSTYKMPDVLEGNYRYNTEDINASYIVGFNTDISDEYTIENYTGTSYQTLTEPATVTDIKKVNLTGLTDVPLQVALGNRKGDLTGFEKFLAIVAGTVDDLVNALGGNSSLKGQIVNRLGALKVSSNYHSIPKVLYLEGGKLPVNHRDVFSAKVLWDNYHSYNSFLSNNYKRQRKIYEGVTIPFGFEQFLTLIENSYFYTSTGAVAKVERLEWNMLKDKATVNYWVEEIYTQNLEETKIEP